MTKYVLEASAMQYMLEAFPRFAAKDIWNSFEDACNRKMAVAEYQTRKELETNLLAERESIDWLKRHSNMFIKMSEKGSRALGKMEQLGILSNYDKSSNLVRKLPISIPFAIAETIALKPNGILVVYRRCMDFYEITNICKRTKLEYMEIEDFLLKLE